MLVLFLPPAFFLAPYSSSALGSFIPDPCSDPQAKNENLDTRFATRYTARIRSINSPRLNSDIRNADDNLLATRDRIVYGLGASTVSSKKSRTKVKVIAETFSLA
jgi:hypothetical protein